MTSITRSNADMKHGWEVFPFFDLPRELRGYIYLMIGTKAGRPRKCSESPDSYLTLLGVPEPRVRRVSKQFSDEYNEELALRGPEISLGVDGNIWRRYQGLWEDVTCPIFKAFAYEVESIELEFYGRRRRDYDNMSVVFRYLQRNVDVLMDELPKLKRIKFTATMSAEQWADAHTWYSVADMLSYFDFNNHKDPKYTDLTIECDLRLWSHLFNLVTPARYYEGTASAE
ncbi:hypothetical protein EJ03DRAFT_357408 [Teratosphaeria nubilosa]|uniref:Uncharacterized protein n=1 Tax=Teratosphaeria nubilosa TaxID=161662 RepID=A0A6G1KXL1_9PEZI|nr:hypothetical protein EJ03DRAFT_357408 [Teratosphaeria nubilosa]